MPTINGIIKIIRTIIKSDVFKNMRTDMLVAYLKLTVKRKIITQEHHYSGTEKIMGFNVSYLSFLRLDYLFKEIFIGLDYYFCSDSDEPFILDCGSNIGMSLLFFKKFYPESEIIGFEPGEKAYEKLQENVETNNLKDVTLVNAALSDKEGEITFYVDPDDAGSLIMSTIKERLSAKESQKVKAIVLSKYITKQVDFLKIDIEGAELAVIEELSKSKKISHIKQMTIEYHHHIQRNVDEMSIILSILEKNGFGYQISADQSFPIRYNKLQDIMIYAYKK